jgi:hypothetical protein
MTDPVVATDGYTYERKSIEEWWSNNNTSPVTNKKIRSKKLVPSHSVKEMIDEYNKNADK